VLAWLERNPRPERAQGSSWKQWVLSITRRAVAATATVLRVALLAAALCLLAAAGWSAS
jgi:hypothetical protein